MPSKLKADALQPVQEKVATALAREGVIVTFGASCPAADVAAKHIMLPALPNELDRETQSLLRGWLDHETAHILYTDTKVWKRFSSTHKNKLLHTLTNAIEDSRVERLMQKRYRGSKANLATSNRLGHARLDGKQLDPVLAATGAVGSISSGELSPKDAAALWAGRSSNPKITTKLVTKAEQHMMEARYADSTAEAFEIAERILAAWKEPEPEPEPEEKPAEEEEEEDEDGDEEEEEEDEPEDDEEDSGDDEELEEEDASDEDAGDEEDNEDEKGEGGSGEDDDSDGDEDGEEQEGEPETESEEQDTGPGQDELNKAIEQCEDSENDAPDLNEQAAQALQEKCKPGGGKGSGYRPYRDGDEVVSIEDITEKPRNATFMDRVKSKVGALQGKLRCDLLARAHEWERGQKRGKLDDKSLARFGSGSVRVFKKRLPKQGIDLALTVLVDMSGSMSGGRLPKAAELAYALSDAACGIGVVVEVLGFTTGHSGCFSHEPFDRTDSLEMVEVKTFSEKKNAQFIDKFKRMSGYQGNFTPETDAVEFAARRLLARSEERRMLIVICDGGPDHGASLPHMLKRVEEAGIELVGIGIQTDEQEKYYKNAVTYHDLDNMLGDFYDKFRKLLKGGAKKRR